VAKSPGVKAEEEATMDFLLPAPPNLLPVIFVMLYVENRFDARLSRASLCLRAARELAIAGAGSGSRFGGSKGGCCDSGEVGPSSGSGGTGTSSITTEGTAIGLSTRE
jgi:hypothetical protein